MIHLFHTYGKVEDGYQYCLKCGKARIIPCSHKWVLSINIEERISVEDAIPWGLKKVYHCSKCGEVKIVRV